MLTRWSSRRRTAALTAAGVNIDLSDRAAVERFSRRRGASWQNSAWNYRELIGELGAGINYQAEIVSKVGFVIAATSDDDEPLPLPRGVDTPEHEVPDHVLSAARECLDLLPFRNGYSFQGLMLTNLRVAGECYLHGTTVKDRERWRVLSTDAVTPQGSSFAVRAAPGDPARPLPKGDALLRLWKPHPRWEDWPDSPMRGLIDVCEDVVLTGRELRAAARSRVAANGILLVPDSIAIVRKPDGSVSDFHQELEVLMLAPIAHEGSAGAVVPIVLRGTAEDLDKVRHIVLAREDSPSLIGKLEAALARLRDGMSMPSDAAGSVRDMNHWSAWAVTQDNWKNYMEPGVRLMTDSLTQAYLRPRLTLPESRGGWGLTDDEVDLVQVWYDAGNITENANRSEDADAAYDRGEIGGKAYRAAKGFAETDAPDDEEMRKMLTWKAAGALTPEVVARLIGDATGIAGMQVAVGGRTVETPRREPVRVIGARTDSPGGGTAGTQPTQPVPNNGKPVVGAADPQGVLDSDGKVVSGQRLADIERSLMERLMVAVDDALLRALEKAGARARSAAQGRKELAAEVRGLEPEQVCQMMGAQAVAELGLTEDFLLAQAFDRLRAKFTSWTAQAVRDAVKAVVELAGLPLSMAARLTDRLVAKVGQGWSELETRLRERATALLYGTTGEARGEVPDSLARPSDLRAALTVIGGDGGLALGREMLAALDAQGERLGITWRYGITPRNTFHPHLALDTARLSGWDDPRLIPEPKYSWVGPHYRPGDHDGCLCDVVPTWWVPDMQALLAKEVMRDNPGAAADRLLAQLDDAAGRTGTWAQRGRDERERVLAVQRRWIEGTGR